MDKELTTRDAINGAAILDPSNLVGLLMEILTDSDAMCDYNLEQSGVTSSWNDPTTSGSYGAAKFEIDDKRTGETYEITVRRTHTNEFLQTLYRRDDIKKEIGQIARCVARLVTEGDLDEASNQADRIAPRLNRLRALEAELVQRSKMGDRVPGFPAL